MKLKLILKMFPTEFILALDSEKKSKCDGKALFQFLSRIFTFTLTLRRRITYIYTFFTYGLVFSYLRPPLDVFGTFM